MAKYKDFKDFLQHETLKFFKAHLQKHVEWENHINEQSCEYCSIEKLKVGALRCFNLRDDEFDMDIGISCIVHIVDKATNWEIGLGTRKWYTVHTHDRLDDELTINVLGVETYKKNQPMKEKACSEFLVPYLSNADMEDLADKFVTEVYKDYNPRFRYRLPRKTIEEKFNLKVYSADMPEDFLGKIYFKDTKDDSFEISSIQSGTLIINRHGKYMGELSKKRFIYSHEIGHWFIHPMYFKLCVFLYGGQFALAYDANLGPYNDNMSPAEKAHWFSEEQANTFAKDVMTPRIHFLPRYREYLNNDRSPENVTKALNSTAYHFDVSNFMAKRRARELGIEEADGVFVYVDGRWYAPFSFTSGSLNTNQTFVINRKDHDEICRKDKEYVELIRTGKFIYLGYVTCINDPKYVTVGDIRCKKTDHPDGRRYGDTVKGLVLTDYARHHVDECCLKFTSSCKKIYNGKHEYFEAGYLADELNASILMKKKCTNDLANQTVKDRAETERRLKKEGHDFMEILRNLPNSFSATLNILIENYKDKDTKKMTNIELSIRTGLHENYISRLRNNVENIENISLHTVCALCVALHLPPCFSRDLLRKAGKKFPETENGYIQERILETLYSEPLSSVDELLIENGIAPWGKTN